MNIKLPSEQTKFNPTLKIAIIYSLDHLFGYTVQIKQGFKNYYITYNDEPAIFGNMGDVRRAVLKENVAEAYLALSKTSEETDLSALPAHQHEHYDYSRVALNPEK